MVKPKKKKIRKLYENPEAIVDIKINTERHIRHLLVTRDTVGEVSQDILIAYCNDRSLWKFKDDKWNKLPDIPQDTVHDKEGDPEVAAPDEEVEE